MSESVHSYKLSDLEALGATGETIDLPIPGFTMVMVSFYLRGTAVGNQAKFQLEGFILNHAGNVASGDVGGSGRVAWFNNTISGGHSETPQIAAGAAGLVEKDAIIFCKPHGRGNLTAEALRLKVRADIGSHTWTPDAVNDMVEMKVLVSEGGTNPPQVGVSI